MSVNAPLTYKLSGRFDWTESYLRKMGDDLGDEWWTHEGDSGTFIACHFIYFSVRKLLLRVVYCMLFCESK